VGEAIVDTNVPVRVLTNAPLALSELAAAIIAAAEERGADLVLAPLVVAEIVFVLTRVEGWPRERVVEALLALFASGALVVLEQEIVEQALEWFRDVPSLHFVDAYVAALAVSRGHENVISFDRALRRITAIHLIDTPAAVPSA
jgi:predicted nucleic acid-binding protein